MDKDIKSAVITIIVIAAIITGAYFGGLLSVIDTTEKHFRQQSLCGRTNVFEFDAVKIEYTTQAVSSSIIDPDDDRVNECVPVYVKITEDNVVMFEYDQARDGVIIDKFTPSIDYDVAVDDYQTLDDDSIYIIPDFYVEDMDFVMYSNVDSVGTSPYYSIKIPKEEKYNRLQGLYSFDIDNDGWDRNGRTEGSELYFHIYPNKGPLDSSVSVVDGQAVLEVVSGFPTQLSYEDVCMNFGVVGFAGGVQYDTVCLGTGGIIDRKETVIFTFDIPDTNATEYYLRGDVIGMQMVLSTITTDGVLDRDIERYLIDGNRIEAGNLIGDEVQIFTEQEPVEEEPGQVEEPVDEEPVEQPAGETENVLDGIAWYTYVIIGAALLFIIIAVVVRTRGSGGKRT